MKQGFKIEEMDITCISPLLDLKISTRPFRRDLSRTVKQV